MLLNLYLLLSYVQYYISFHAIENATNQNKRMLDIASSKLYI